jgi:DNA-binding NarL/FixJ family response regulator
MNDQESKKEIRIVLLLEHGLLRASLARVLASEPGFQIAGEAGTSAEAWSLVEQSSPHVVLLDLELGAGEASAFLSVAQTQGYQGKVLIVAGRVDVGSAVTALQLGAAGVFLKSEPPARLVQAIGLVAGGGLWIDQEIIHLLADRYVHNSSGLDDRPGNGSLGRRQQEVLRGILGGLTNKKIANSMGLSESAVKNILQGLFSRAGVRSRSQLVRLALEGSLGNLTQSVA